MPLEQVGLEAIFDTREFIRGQRIYENALRQINSSTRQTAASMELDWGAPTAGLEDLFAQMDVLEGKAGDLADEAAAFSQTLTTGASGAAAALGTVGAAAIGVAAGLAIAGAAAVLVWRKIDDYAKEYIRTNEEIVKAQEAVNAEWKKAGEYVGAAFTPVKKMLLDVEKAIAETVGRIAKFYAEIAAMTFSTIAGMWAQLKELPGLIMGVLKGEITIEEAMKRQAEAGYAAFRDTMAWYGELFEEVGKEADDTWEKIADIVNGTLDRIEDMERDHNRRLAEMEEDHLYRRARAWAKYEQDVQKEIAKGQEAIAKLEAKYEESRAKAIASYNKRVAKAEKDLAKDIVKLEAKYQEDRAKAIADYGKRVVKAEKDLAQDIAKAQADYALRERQTRERYNLDRIQGERRYQYERARLVAEGDTLAIEELDARYKLEQQEVAENEALRKKQAKETQDAMVAAMEAAGRAQAEAMAQALAEQLAELQEKSREQIEERQQAHRELQQELAEALTEQLAELQKQSGKEIEEQRQTNQERLEEMAANFAEQQRLADEDYQRSVDKANRNYQRQQEDMGRDLARKEELQKVGADAIRILLEQYYGPGGVTTNIMNGYFEGMEKKANVTADAVIAAMQRMARAVELSRAIGEGSAMGGIPMQYGGIVTGPQTVRVESGVVEAFIPLTGPGARGGSFDLSWAGGPIPIAGLEGASPANVNEIAKALAKSLTEKVRARRRG